MAIVIVPGLFMLIMPVFRRNLLKSRLYIVIGQTRLIFGSRNSGGRADIEKRNDAIFDAGCGHCVADQSGNILNISITCRLKLYRLRLNHLSETFSCIIGVLP